ncbi:MAG: c-type cytochrome [Burkholderiales bacterium]
MQPGPPGKRVPPRWSPSATRSSSSSGPRAQSPAAASGTNKGAYDKICAVCHSAGIAGAPKTGDKAAWAPRIAAGQAALYNSALKGKNAMPPKGGMLDLPDAEVKAAVDYMVNASK